MLQVKAKHIAEAPAKMTEELKALLVLFGVLAIVWWLWTLIG